MHETKGCRAAAYDAVVVGAGFAGLYMLHRLRGMGLTTLVLEQAGGIGGTWYWNRYPGARCDVESLQYSYSFSPEVEQEWSWSERFASQAEILSYLNFVADRFDLRRDIELDARTQSAVYDEGSSMWTVVTADGRSFQCRFLIFATGALSVPLDPVIPGLDAFKGRVLRTATWPHEKVDFTGRRVAVVGTGSSGIQSIPVIAEEAEHLYVLQRTPNYSIPGRNAAMDPAFERDWKANYRAHRAAALKTRSNNLFDAGTLPGKGFSPEEREREFEARWQTGGLGFSYTYPDLTSDAEVNAHATQFFRRKIAEKVADPETAAKLVPSEYPMGGRRLCVDNGYYETFNRDNVTLVDLRREKLVGMTAGGLSTETADYAIDMLVLATGFDAFVGALAGMDVRGRGGQSLAAKWQAAPATYLGIMVAGFPNMFTITGPGSPSVLSNVVLSIEQHVDWIADCLAFLDARGAATIEAKQAAEEGWSEHVAALAEGTLISRTKSWYTGANVEGKVNKPFLYMGGIPAYVQALHEAGPGTQYAGLELS